MSIFTTEARNCPAMALDELTARRNKRTRTTTMAMEQTIVLFPSDRPTDFFIEWPPS
jgi:hypothetical protein